MARILLSDVKVEMSLKSWVLLSKEYKNLDGELEMLCPEGHKVYMSLKQWRKKAECIICSKQDLKTLDNVIKIQKGENIFRTFALDDSTTTTGWSIFDDNKLVKSGEIKMTQADYTERISAMKQWMLGMIEKWEPDLVAIEDIQQQKSPKTFKILSHLQGVLMNALFEKGVKYEVIHSATWRSHCEIKGSSKKELKRDAQRKVKELYEKNVSEDEADAICLGICAAEKYGKSNDFSEWD